jgi:hypothetical protein
MLTPASKREGIITHRNSERSDEFRPLVFKPPGQPAGCRLSTGGENNYTTLAGLAARKNYHRRLTHKRPLRKLKCLVQELGTGCYTAGALSLVKTGTLQPRSRFYYIRLKARKGLKNPCLLNSLDYGTGDTPVRPVF